MMYQRKLISLVFALAMILAPSAATASVMSQELLLIAPQLQSFAGSQANLESLANGLRSGSAVTLTSLAADGTQQTVRFTPAQALSAADAARVLEAARQRLIANGIAAPTAQEIGIALMGGTLAAPAGAVKLDGLLAAADPKNPLVVARSSFAGSESNYRNLVRSLEQGAAVTLTVPGRPAVQFTAPGGPMSAQEVQQALQLARELLAAQGIHQPTAEQLRAALVGGSVAAASGAQVALRGVLEGRTRATSASPQTFTSDVPRTGHTSDRPAGFTSDTPPPAESRERAPEPPPAPFKRKIQPK
jgi:hypothetical protein